LKTLYDYLAAGDPLDDFRAALQNPYVFAKMATEWSPFR
jgi:hypothetical protein